MSEECRLKCPYVQTGLELAEESEALRDCFMDMGAAMLRGDSSDKEKLNQLASKIVNAMSGGSINIEDLGIEDVSKGLESYIGDKALEHIFAAEYINKRIALMQEGCTGPLEISVNSNSRPGTSFNGIMCDRAVEVPDVQFVELIKKVED